MKNTVEMGVITTSGKKFYVLTKNSGSLPFGYGSRVCIADANGKPKMWTRKADAIAYAKKNGLYIMSGLNYLGGGATGPSWM